MDDEWGHDITITTVKPLTEDFVSSRLNPGVNHLFENKQEKKKSLKIAKG